VFICQMRKFFSTLWKSRHLITTWTRYNIEGTYLDTKLGAIWIVLQPIILTLIYATVFGLFLARKPRGDVPFVSFFLAGLVFWQFFSDCVMHSSVLMTTKMNMISQIKFPKEALIFVDFLEKLVDFVVTFLILIILNAFYGFYPTLSYFYLPVILLTAFSITLGIMFILSALGVFVQDTPQITSLVLRFLFYFSGILISADMVSPKIASILSLNPLFFLIESFRNVILYSEAPDFITMSLWLVFSILFLIAGVAFFKANDGTFPDYQ
jgi:lipopolysaccharide transport system permease protein